MLGPHTLMMQYCIDTYEEIINKLSREFQKFSPETDVKLLFYSNIQNNDGTNIQGLTTFVYADTADVEIHYNQMKNKVHTYISP